jgi:hypothetical protein
VGAEGPVSAELGDAIAGHKPATETWKGQLGLGHYYDGWGTQNIVEMAWAVALLLSFAAARDTWVQILRFQQTRWMGSEPLSFIYGPWRLVAVGAVAMWAHAHGDTELASLADGWLLHWFGLGELCLAPDGQVIWPGARSAGHPPNPGWRELAQAIGMGRDTSQAIRWGQEAHLGMGEHGVRSWMFDALEVLTPTLQNACRPLAGGADPLSVLPRYGLVTRITILRFANGDVVAYLESDPNSNTPAWMMMAWIAGAVTCFPKDGGIRIRQQRDDATVHSIEQAGDVLVYKSSLYGEDKLVLPAGIVREIVLPLTGDVVQVGPGGHHPIDPPPPPPPPADSARAAALHHIADVLAEREFPQKTAFTKFRDLQAALIKELRSGPSRPTAAIADDIDSFGISAWAQISAELRSMT